MYGPTVSRTLLGRALREQRQALGLSQAQVAARLGCATGKIAYIETARNSVNEGDFDKLADLYGMPDETREALTRLRAQGTQRSWFSSMKLLDERFRRYLGLETEAEQVRCVHSELLPGLLQSEGYARLLHRCPSPDGIARMVAVRLRRQQRLTGPNPLRVSAVISMAALVRCANTPTVAHEQIDHLIRYANMPHVDLRVLPFTTGLHGATSAFTLLDFPEGALPRQVWTESLTGGHLVDDQTEVDRAATLYDELHGQALDTSVSLTELVKLASEVREHSVKIELGG